MFIKYNFHKIFLIFFLVFFGFGTFAKKDDKFTITVSGPVIQDGIGFIQNITLTFKANSSWTLYVTSLDNTVKNNSYPYHNLDLNRFRIVDQATGSEFLPLYGQSTIIKTGGKKDDELTDYTVNLQIRLICPESDYPGQYSAGLQFNLVTKNKNYSEVYSPVYPQELIQYLTILPSAVNYSVPEDKLLSKAQTISISQPTRILVKSNKEWKLSIIANPSTSKITQKFKVNLCPENSQILVGEDFVNINTTETPFIQGVSSMPEGDGALQAQAVEIDYQFQTSATDIIPSGAYPFTMQFRLTDR
jgi:hypothetical protein